MPRVNNYATQVETPLSQLQQNLKNLQPGQKLSIANTKEEILSTQRNLLQNRSTIVGADSHLEYVEALLIAEANGKLQFGGS
jgi:hypothetical protein